MNLLCTSVRSTFSKLHEDDGIWLSGTLTDDAYVPPILRSP
jgi:hypothetical protein